MFSSLLLISEKLVEILEFLFFVCCLEILFKRNIHIHYPTQLFEELTIYFSLYYGYDTKTT